MPKGPWICVRQRAGPLVKECRALRPNYSKTDTPDVRREKAEIKRNSGDSSVCRTRRDRLELRLALFGGSPFFTGFGNGAENERLIIFISLRVDMEIIVTISM